MKTTFSNVFSKFSKISALETQEENHIKSLTIGVGGAIVVGSRESNEYMREPRPCSQALKAFLKECPTEQIYALTALMYAGRDGEQDPVSLWVGLGKTISNKESACQAILEKSPRIEYIEAALKNLPMGMTLDDLPTLISEITDDTSRT